MSEEKKLTPQEAMQRSASAKLEQKLGQLLSHVAHLEAVIETQSTQMQAMSERLKQKPEETEDDDDLAGE